MVKLNCAICADHIRAADDAFVTKCGHMFHHLCLVTWLERSKTCPQCRTECSEQNIFRVYFNSATSSQQSLVDCGSPEQRENLILQLELKEQEMEILKKLTELKQLLQLEIKEQVMEILKKRTASEKAICAQDLEFVETLINALCQTVNFQKILYENAFKDIKNAVSEKYLITESERVNWENCISNILLVVQIKLGDWKKKKDEQIELKYFAGESSKRPVAGGSKTK